MQPIDRPPPLQPIPFHLEEPGIWSNTNLPLGPPPAHEKRLIVAGHVVTHDGQPAAGTQVLLVAYRQRIATTQSTDDGLFSFGEVELPILDHILPVVGPVVWFRLYTYAGNRCIAVTDE